jgi:hypothetical protein
MRLPLMLALLMAVSVANAASTDKHASKWAGTLSVFAFNTPVPYPFGAERTGYLVVDLEAAVHAAQAAGADVLVQPFPDAIGRDAVIQWPGGINMQLYWHTAALRRQDYAG